MTISYSHKIRVWDQATSDDIFITETGQVFNERGEKCRATSPEYRVGISVWSAASDGASEAEQIRIARESWAEGYDGDPDEICAEVEAIG